MSYKIKEVFFTLQGEGAHTGRAAVFCRFTGCNLWSGREKDRAKSRCSFCDTDFVGMDGTYGGRYSAQDLARQIEELWPKNNDSRRFVVFTGGEPLLQLNSELVAACKDIGFEVAVETNGTKTIIDEIDWVCVSPKPGYTPQKLRGDEIKLVFPQPQKEMDPSHFESLPFEHFFLQPMDGPRQKENILAAIAYCQANPKWRLSLQTHKIIGLR
jgi:7-carboxy-7-deazaguanine synthase